MARNLARRSFNPPFTMSLNKSRPAPRSSPQRPRVRHRAQCLPHGRAPAWAGTIPGPQGSRNGIHRPLADARAGRFTPLMRVCAVKERNSRECREVPPSQVVLLPWPDHDRPAFRWFHRRAKQLCRIGQPLRAYIGAGRNSVAAVAQGDGAVLSSSRVFTSPRSTARRMANTCIAPAVQARNAKAEEPARWWLDQAYEQRNHEHRSAAPWIHGEGCSVTPQQNTMVESRQQNAQGDSLGVFCRVPFHQRIMRSRTFSPGFE